MGLVCLSSDSIARTDSSGKAGGIAGIPRDAFKIEINNRDIHVFYHIPFSVNGKQLSYPVTVYDGPVPFDVDVKKVKANFQEESLQIILPFNDLEGGYSKRIRIAS